MAFGSSLNPKKILKHITFSAKTQGDKNDDVVEFVDKKRFFKNKSECLFSSERRL